MPILYPVNQTVFIGNGIGILSDVTKCRCTETLEDFYEVEFQIPKDGLHAMDISINQTIKAKPNHKDDPQLFRIYSVEKNYDGYIVGKAAHISYDTSGIPIKPFTSRSLSEAVEHMNNDRILQNTSKFVLNSDFSLEGVLEVKKPTSFRSLLGGSDTSIKGIYGGDYHYDNYVINHVEKRGTNKGVCFRYSKNIIGFEQETNSEDLYTAVIGFWKKSSNDNQDPIYGNIINCEGTFPYDKIYILDTSSDIEVPNNGTATVDQIDECVTKYIKSNMVGVPKNKMKIDYVEDDNIVKVCLGDEVGVIFPDYGIKALARCNKVVFDCLLEKNESIEIGVVDTDLSDSIAQISAKS